MNAVAFDDAKGRVSRWARDYLISVPAWLPAVAMLLVERSLLPGPTQAAVFGVDERRVWYVVIVLLLLPIQLRNLVKGAQRHLFFESLEVIADRNLLIGRWKRLSPTRFGAMLTLGLLLWIYVVSYLSLPLPGDSALEEIAKAVFHVWLAPAFMLILCSFAFVYLAISRKRRRA